MKFLWRKINDKLPIPQKYRKFLGTMTLGVAVIFITMVLYQNVNGYNSIQLPIDDTQQKEINKLLSTVQNNENILLNNNSVKSNTANYHHLENKSFIKQHPTNAKNNIWKHFITKNSLDLDNLNFSEISRGAVTATPKPPTTELDDIFISVKTTKSYHESRLAVIIKTWFQLAKGQTWFFTDINDKLYQEKTNGHMINTNCSMGHFRKALCCKMSVELDVFLESGKKWFCHFDDDNYVNVPRLVRLLDDYSSSTDWYLGKPSISSPLELYNDNKKPSSDKKITFWFATGGAGFCISRALAFKMLPIAGGGKFVSIGDKIRFPDDVTMGFIIEHILNIPLTVIDSFHSHLEPMEFLRPEIFHDQVSFSYSRIKDQWNVVKIDGFDTKTDPNRFYSLHCHLFPYFSYCPR